MSNKVEGAECPHCKTTLRYPAKGRKFGPCVQCTKSRSKALVFYYENRESRQYDLDFRLNLLVINARARAKKQSIPFNIDTIYIKSLWDLENGRCALSGRELTLDYNPKGGPHMNGPSLDKIIPELGYIPGNVRIVTYHVNTALSNFGEEALIQLLEDIKNNKDSKCQIV